MDSLKLAIVKNSIYICSEKLSKRKIDITCSNKQTINFKLTRPVMLYS